MIVTAEGHVTFPKDVLEHLGVEPDQRVGVEKIPGGRIIVRAALPTGTIDDFIGLMAHETSAVATIEEIGDATADAWAGKID